MSYIVLARKYRPQTFAEVYAQDHVTKILINALEQGRIAHAYLFTGPRGVGKTSMARILAKVLTAKRVKKDILAIHAQLVKRLQMGLQVMLLKLMVLQILVLMIFVTFKEIYYILLTQQNIKSIL